MYFTKAMRMNHISKGIFGVLLVACFALYISGALSGCQYTVDTNPDVNLTEVHVSPIGAVVALGGRLALSATTLGFSSSSTVSWSIEGTNNGTITSNGLTAVYYAPLAPNLFSSIVTIRVTSDDNPNRYVECPVVLMPSSSSVFMTDPMFDTLLTGSSQQFFVDTAFGATVPAIRWEMVSGPGTVSDGGIYTPPSTIDSDGVQATLRAISQSDSTVYSESTIILRNASDSERCFTRDILPLLSASCGSSGCHDASGRAEFNALTYSGTVNGRNVVAGDARRSRIFQAIIDFNANTRMPPPPQPALPPNQVLKIGQWINEGAPNCQ